MTTQESLNETERIVKLAEALQRMPNNNHQQDVLYLWSTNESEEDIAAATKIREVGNVRRRVVAALSNLDILYAYDDPVGKQLVRRAFELLP